MKELFLEALELVPLEREAFLVGACEDEDMQTAVRALLQASGEADQLFKPIERWVAAAPKGGDDLIGRRVGAYQLDQFLGRGGMGTVYRAQRADGHFEQRVAVKLLSFGAMTPEMHRRFLAEREILARLEHPNVGRLFDGGVTEDGTPYFVMEYVEGASIDVYCDEGTLDIAARVRLFLQVCEAVAHAHANGVVHRDLKPANILIADGQAKLLDFGIAKLLDGDGLQTATGHSPMTPAYASPEQLRSETVTEATDVYSLGVVLHELLTGLSPYESEPTSGVAILKAICEDPVRAPSTRLRTTTLAGEDAGLGDIARSRKMTTGALARRMRGDLDTILLKTLRKEPDRRYASVEALAEDLRRHLDGYPVLARRESHLYRSSRFVRRHRAVSVAAAIAALLASTALWLFLTREGQERRFDEERDRSDDLLGRLIQMYDAADPAAAAGATVASRKLLDQAVEPLRSDPPEDPATRATLLFAAGRVYRRIGLPGEARPLLTQSLDLRRELHEAPDDALAEVLFELGTAAAQSGSPEEAVGLLEQVLTMERALHGDDFLHVAQARYALGTSLHDAGRGGAAEHFTEAVRIYRMRAAEPTAEYADALIALGDWLAVKQDVAGSIEAYEEAHSIFLELHGDEHPTVARALGGLGLLYYNDDREEEGTELLREAVRLYRRAYDPEGHPQLASTLQNLGAVLVALGNREGLEHMRAAFDMTHRLPDTSETSRRFITQALVTRLRSFGEIDQAIEVYEQLIANANPQNNDDPLARTEPMRSLATLLQEEGQTQRAVELMTEILSTYEAALPPDDPRTITLRKELEVARSE